MYGVYGWMQGVKALHMEVNAGLLDAGLLDAVPSILPFDAVPYSWGRM